MPTPIEDMLFEQTSLGAPPKKKRGAPDEMQFEKPDIPPADLQKALMDRIGMGDVQKSAGDYQKSVSAGMDDPIESVPSPVDLLQAIAPGMLSKLGRNFRMPPAKLPAMSMEPAGPRNLAGIGPAPAEWPMRMEPRPMGPMQQTPTDPLPPLPMGRAPGGPGPLNEFYAPQGRTPVPGNRGANVGQLEPLEEGGGFQWGALPLPRQMPAGNSFSTLPMRGPRR